MRMRALVVLILMLVASSRRAETVDLKYQYDGDAEHIEYVLTARASADWQIGEPGSGSYRVRFQVDETIRPQPDGGAIVDVTMTPHDVHERRPPAPRSERLS